MMPNIFIRCDNRYIRIDIREIRHIESRKNYVRIVTPARTHLALISMSQLEKELPASQFCRVHRSYIVSIPHISSFDSESVYLPDTTIPISPTYRHALTEKVRVLVSETRTRVSAES